MVKITLRLPKLSFDNLVFLGFFLFVIYLIYKNYFKESAHGKKSHDNQQEDENDNRPKLTILYGSQTGTAESFANILQKEASRQYGFNAKAIDLADYESPEEKLPQENLLIFTMATYGEGEPTDNARDFWDFLFEEEHDEDFLSNVQYTVFGLGNKQYKIYQAAGRGIDKRMKELGAQRIFERGEGDADGTLDEDWEEWKTKILPLLAQRFGTQVETKTSIGKQYEIEYVDARPPRSPFKPPSVNGGQVDQKHPSMAKIIENRELLHSDSRSTRHIEVDISDTNIKYEAGDHLGVLAKNDTDMVNDYAKYFEVQDKMEQVFRLLPSNPQDDFPAIFPHACQTIRTTFEYYLDLTSRAKLQFLKALLTYVTDESQKDRLQSICDSKDHYHEYVVKADRMPLEVLRDFDSARMPLEHFIELVPRLQPRYYSIASSSKQHPNSIHIVVAVVEYSTPAGRTAKGVCSTHLQSLDKGSVCPVFVRHSNFHLPNDAEKPVIMIGPGTGIAPFVGFLQQRRAWKENEHDNLGECHLYFGCRRRAEDYIYAEEMKRAREDGVISQLSVAFSREQESKDYVQHHLKRDGALVWDIIEQGGYVYVCGDAKYMAKDVDRVLAEIVQHHGNYSSRESAVRFIDALTSNGRYLRDVWSP
eukprot:gb/GECH01013517.1/.p1 GENE.gb/GECH01013517.1/~~gb/GECH01013517.1/.p1  ORF type:complete len:646 (+),score=145.49 gb/GECH01013517.1/:1-1938(+)